MLLLMGGWLIVVVAVVVVAVVVDVVDVVGCWFDGWLVY